MKEKVIKMSNSENKRNIVDLTANATPSYSDTITKKWNDVEVEIKQVLTPTEVSNFVMEVVLYCFAGEKQVYSPELKDIAIKLGIIKYYTGLAMPGTIDDEYVKLLYKYDIVDFVIKEINRQQFSAIIESIDDKIEYILDRTGTIVSSKLAELLETVVKAVENYAKNFEGIDGDKLADMVSAISGNKIDEEKIVAAVMKQRERGKKVRRGKNR